MIEIKPTYFLCPHCGKEIQLQEVLQAAPPHEIAQAMRARRKSLPSLSSQQASAMGKRSGEMRSKPDRRKPEL